MAAVQRAYKEGQYVFKEGDRSTSMFLVRKGTVGVRKVKGSTFVEIGRVYPNQVIGELSFFDRQARSAAAVALSDVELVEIDFAALDEMWGKVPDYLKSIISSMADRLRKANETIRRLKPNQVDETLGATEAEPQVAASATSDQKPS